MSAAVPATIRSTSEFSISEAVGFITHSPFMRPTRGDDTGPSKGISVIVKAAEAASATNASGKTSASADIN